MFKNYVSIRGCRLNTYSCSIGGGMSGGYYSETVKRYQDYVLISIKSAEWHSDEPSVSEYVVDVGVLDEIEAVVRKYKMNFWHRKKFTNMFICDGESKSYHFDFDNANIYFSSQIYPEKYRKMLNELDEIVKKYMETGEKLQKPENDRPVEE